MATIKATSATMRAVSDSLTIFIEKNSGDYGTFTCATIHIRTDNHGKITVEFDGQPVEVINHAE